MTMMTIITLILLLLVINITSSSSSSSSGAVVVTIMLLSPLVLINIIITVACILRYCNLYINQVIIIYKPSTNQYFLQQVEYERYLLWTTLASV